ncbi:MAG: 4-oxalocrotonate decarboxylase [Flavobacteriaceae bacterium]|nr:4-oxalocrotonate decarboxylase [Flavobacteriaceae bacterium]
MASIQEIAETLHQAALQAKPIPQISLVQPISLTQAYEIQKILIQYRLDDGETLIGLKMGFTSEAKMQQMGVHDLIWGRLTSSMLIPNNHITQTNRYIHPRVEPEICFRVGKDIDGELDETEVINYIDGVAAALEIIDSRYQNFKFSLEDVVADNCSSIGFVVGDWMPVSQSLKNLNMELRIDHKIVASGSSNDIMNNPWKSLSAATRLATQYGEPIKKGMFIMAGAATNAEFVFANQTASAFVETLESVSLQFI